MTLIDFEQYRNEGAEWGRLVKAVKFAAIESDETRDVPCPNGAHSFYFCVKRVGDRGDAKVQWSCDWCGLGAEGWVPAGAWANK